MQTFPYILHIFHPYLKLYNPQKAKHGVREQHSKTYTRERNKDYAHYFSLTTEARHSLVTSMNITGVTEWIHRNLEKENALKKTKNQLKRVYKQQHGIHVAGILACYL